MPKDNIMYFILNHDCIVSAHLSDDNLKVTIEDTDKQTTTIKATMQSVRAFLNY